MARLTPEDIAERKAAGFTNQEIAEQAGVSEATIRRWARPAATSVETKEDGTLEVTAASEDEVRALVRENGLDPDRYDIIATKLSKWGTPGAEQRSVSATLRLKSEHVLPAPADVDLQLPQAAIRVSVHEPSRVIIEGDHHAPYHDPALDALLTRAHAELRPDIQVFLGDLGDYPTISKHKDHPAAMATVNQCIQGSFDILKARRFARPAPEAYLLRGNHDWRIEAEILARAERIYGIAAADQGDGEREPLFSLRRALHLDALGVALLEDPRGWEHDELVLVPGPQGLVVRHGYLHAKGYAGKTVEKRGMSAIVGHGHRRETAHVWDAYTRTHRLGLALGVCSRTDKHFGHYAPENDWAQGAGFVEIWPDGRWVAEHMYYDDGVLTLRDRRWELI